MSLGPSVRRRRRVEDFCSSSLLEGYDEPEILPSSSQLRCLIGADAEQSRIFSFFSGSGFGSATTLCGWSPATLLPPPILPLPDEAVGKPTGGRGARSPLGSRGPKKKQVPRPSVPPRTRTVAWAANRARICKDGSWNSLPLRRASSVSMSQSHRLDVYVRPGRPDPFRRT